MKSQWQTWKMLAAAGIALVLAACDRGPLEKAGKSLDHAGEKAGDKIREIGK